MDEMLLPMAVWMQTRWAMWSDTARRAWARRADDDGMDEAVTKMIWLAVGIVVALAATAFFTAKFNQAKGGVPDPVAP